MDGMAERNQAQGKSEEEVGGGTEVNHSFLSAAFDSNQFSFLSLLLSKRSLFSYPILTQLYLQPLSLTCPHRRTCRHRHGGGGRGSERKGMREHKHKHQNSNVSRNVHPAFVDSLSRSSLSHTVSNGEEGKRKRTE
jgi:hypothetical protein